MKRQDEVISHVDEERMWNAVVLGDDTPEKLLHTLLFFNGVHFALRSGQEHRILTVNQIRVIPFSDNPVLKG